MPNDIEVLGALYTPQQMDRAFFWIEALNFSTSIAGGASTDAVPTRLNNEGDFLVDSMQFTAWIPSASGSAVAFTPLAKRSEAVKNNNTFACLDALRLQLANDGKDMFSTPIRVGLLFGDGIEPYYPLQKIRIVAGGTITGRLYNDSGETIQAQLAFVGRKIPR